MRRWLLALAVGLLSACVATPMPLPGSEGIVSTSVQDGSMKGGDLGIPLEFGGLPSDTDGAEGSDGIKSVDRGLDGRLDAVLDGRLDGTILDGAPSDAPLDVPAKPDAPIDAAQGN
jgi:hypothetical protein